MNFYKINKIVKNKCKKQIKLIKILKKFQI